MASVIRITAYVSVHKPQTANTAKIRLRMCHVQLLEDGLQLVQSVECPSLHVQLYTIAQREGQLSNGTILRIVLLLLQFCILLLEGLSLLPFKCLSGVLMLINRYYMYCSIKFQQYRTSYSIWSSSIHPMHSFHSTVNNTQ